MTGKGLVWLTPLIYKTCHFIWMLGRNIQNTANIMPFSNHDPIVRVLSWSLQGSRAISVIFQYAFWEIIGIIRYLFIKNAPTPIHQARYYFRCMTWLYYTVLFPSKHYQQSTPQHNWESLLHNDLSIGKTEAYDGAELRPVSYTHLDVYKRQVVNILIRITKWSSIVIQLL